MWEVMTNAEQKNDLINQSSTDHNSQIGRAQMPDQLKLNFEWSNKKMTSVPYWRAAPWTVLVDWIVLALADCGRQIQWPPSRTWKGRGCWTWWPSKTTLYPCCVQSDKQKVVKQTMTAERQIFRKHGESQRFQLVEEPAATFTDHQGEAETQHVFFFSWYLRHTGLPPWSSSWLLQRCCSAAGCCCFLSSRGGSADQEKTQQCLRWIRKEQTQGLKVCCVKCGLIHDFHIDIEAS